MSNNNLSNLSNDELVREVNLRIVEIEKRVQGYHMDPLQISGDSNRTDGTLTFGDFYSSDYEWNSSSDYC